MNKIVSFLV